MNLSAPMIHAFLDNIRYITIELNGLILYGARDDVRARWTSRAAGIISCGSCDRWSKKCRSRSASATGTSNSAPT
jgi:hypothetical protein